MKRLTENLETITEQIRVSFAAKDEAREKVLPACREVIRYCATSIRSIHRQEFAEAEGLLKSARELLGTIHQTLDDQKELLSTGFVCDAEKEFAEGNITLALVTSQPLPSPTDLNVDAAAYMNGMGEAVGELRRYLLDGMRRGDLSRGEELLGAMDDIYSALVTMDFPDAITRGLRRTTDMFRGVLERTRSDLTLTMRQMELENRLKSFETK